MSIAIIDYGSGNLRSAQKAFARMADSASDGKATRRAVELVRTPDDVRHAEHIILPGVGAFGDCLAGLSAIDGMMEALNEAVVDKGRPFLGICVGLQLMCARGLERGTHPGLGWFDAEVAALDVPAHLKVPHMGWNDLQISEPHPVLDGLHGADMYFVHGYAARPLSAEAEGDVIARVDYGVPVVAAMARDNMVGTQFHPEKSQQAGLRLISNFLEWRP